MTKNCAFCGRKFVSVHPRHRFCGRPCREKAEYERLPNTGSGSPSTRAMSHYWLTAKGYKAIGKRPPRAVVKTDRELAKEPAATARNARIEFGEGAVVRDDYDRPPDFAISKAAVRQNHFVGAEQIGEPNYLVLQDGFAALAALVRADNPQGLTLADIAERWGEGITSAQLHALRVLEES